MPLLVSTDWLAAHLDDPNVRIVDARWYLADLAKGEADYQKGHIPNAVYLSVDRHLASHPLLDAKTGRHPLPTPEAFTETMENAGISANTQVVAYDDAGGANAARVWWLLHYFGHDNASLLDGGLHQWLKEGRPLSLETPTFPRGEFHAQPHPHLIVTKEEMKELTRNPHVVMFDARIRDRYQGKGDPVDPRPGHIPGAKSAPTAENLRAPDDLRFKEPEAMRAHYDALGANGADEIVTYCGSGVTACADLFALELAGYDKVRLYVGSFSEWSRDPTLPVITGPDPY
ncbi:MAG TPA: sulfurtransferase, partial [Anaerolineae bacterium]|nr:sulfurtransferase [Anaerolineae bacterium]